MHQGKIIKIYENEGLIFLKICNFTPRPSTPTTITHKRVFVLRENSKMIFYS